MTTFAESFTAASLVAHLVGDYVIQSDEMASTKAGATPETMANASRWAAYHALTYALPFLVLTRSPLALSFIIGTHFVIDRWRLARYFCWTKNFVLSGWSRTAASTFFWWLARLGPLLKEPCPDAVWTPFRRPWSECTKTGYPSTRPDWLAVWLMIIADNVAHLCCNAFAVWAWA